jgi:hypothetical protein
MAGSFFVVLVILLFCFPIWMVLMELVQIFGESALRR